MGKDFNRVIYSSCSAQTVESKQRCTWFLRCMSKNYSVHFQQGMIACIVDRYINAKKSSYLHYIFFIFESKIRYDQKGSFRISFGDLNSQVVPRLGFRLIFCADIFPSMHSCHKVLHYNFIIYHS